MRPRLLDLNEIDWQVYRAAIAFLQGRLQERAAIDWALGLKPGDTIKRSALLHLIDGPEGQNLAEPWRTAWRLIEEYWADPGVEAHSSIAALQIQRRLRTGDRSGSLITAIVELVAPRLKIEPLANSLWHLRRLPKRPKKVEDLFRVSLTSGRIIDPSTLDLATLADRAFLVSLALALDAAVAQVLDIARRLGWDGQRHFWRLGEIHRVYYVPSAARAQDELEPDEFFRGIAPLVKLLYAVIARLIDIDISTAVDYVNRYKITDTPVHLRLWAALSRDARVTPAAEVCSKLLSLDDQRFWNLLAYPEIAELRAQRFSEFAPQKQAEITTRLRRRPPRHFWPRKVNADDVKNARLYWAVRELRRIKLAGATLPPPDQAWLAANLLKFPNLVQMTRLDEGFLISPKAHWVPPHPDNRFDLFAGKERLQALENALSSAARGREDDPATRAWDWLRQPGKPLQVLQDLESLSDGGATFPKLWECFCLAHSPTAGQGEDPGQRDFPQESARVLSLLAKMPEATISKAIDGISDWFSTWKKQLVVQPECLSVWLKLWPIAAEVTNAQQPANEEINLNTVVQSSDDREQEDLDTLNTPAGKLVGVFLAACPDLRQNAHPFTEDSDVRQMRAAIIASTGRSGLIAQYRMIEHLTYFLNADPEWTRQYLIPPLSTDNLEAITLWRAVTRQIHSPKVLSIIGEQMVKRATDLRLGRKTRCSLVFSLIVECLHAFKEQRQPVVSKAEIQQMLRSVEDEVRASGAEVVPRFVRENSAPRGNEQFSSPEDLFRTAAKPFLQEFWPQERSLTTPGVSRALADLPTTAKESFAEAVDTIERFLVPFECWSILDYGLYGEEDGNPKLSMIDNPEKADAFLRLLDLTIGTDETAVIPYELADALNQIRKVAPNIAENRAFRRLSNAARRG